MSSRRIAVVAGVVVFVVASVANAAAQSFAVGVKGGPAFSSQLHPGSALDSLTGTSTLYTEKRTGFQAGGFLTWALTSHLAFQPEVLYVTKGVTLNQTDNVTSIDVEVNYIEVPVLLRVGRAVGANRSGAFALIGPGFGIRQSSSARSDVLNGPSTPLDISDVYKQQDIGLVLAGGVEAHRLVIEVRYTIGMTDIVDESVPHTDSVRNRVLSVLAGFKF